MMRQQIAVAIFAGGQSQRMGQDKAQLEINGETLLQRTAKMALDVASRVYVIGRIMPATWPFGEVQFMLDETPHQGPLGGLQTVLKREAEVLTLACDMPKLTTDALGWLLKEREKSQAAHGVIVENADQWEPLFSVYTAQCLPLIEENLGNGRRSMHALIKRGNFDLVLAPPEIQKQLINVNTLEEWAALEDS
ncbi:MAG TPA: molybdenum cofactor guanylyltransferase [Abditibacteriaceae bacterium]|jgi:molybdopterin-guanine dinucleotide biosynthesis protein A